MLSASPPGLFASAHHLPSVIDSFAPDFGERILFAHSQGNLGPQSSAHAETWRQASSLATATEATHYVLSVPTGTTAGQSVTVRMLAFDADNHFVSDYSGTADLSSSDTAATVPASITFDHGRATFQMTFNTDGPQTVTAADQTDSAITATASTNVAAPAVTTHFVVTIPEGATAGAPVTVHVTATDAENFRVKGDNSTVNLTSSDGAATLPSSVTLEDGKATFQVTFGTAGQQTLTTISETDSSVTGQANTNVVDTEPATHFVLSLKQGTQIGATVTVRVTAVDASNRVVSGFSGTANLSSSDSAATLPDNVILTNGRGTFQVTFATAGLQTLVATDSTNASLLGSAVTSVDTAYYAIGLPKGVNAGQTVTVQLLAKDTDNQLLSSYNGTANLTSSDAAATLPASVMFQNGKASVQVTFATAGQQTLTATDNASASPASTATTNVAEATSATHFAVYVDPGTTVGKAETVRVVALDSQNHVATGYSGVADVTSSDAAATLPSSLTFQNGKASFFQVTFATQGQQTLNVTDSSDASISGSANTNVAAQAVVTHFVIALRPGAALGQPTRVLILAQDAQNHVVSDFSGTANLTSSDAAATLPAGVTFKNGRASFEATFATLGLQTIIATNSTNETVTGTASTNVGNSAGGYGERGFNGRFRWSHLEDVLNALVGSGNNGEISETDETCNHSSQS